jgi:uncharacterized delta-60 repeat protein
VRTRYAIALLSLAAAGPFAACTSSENASPGSEDGGPLGSNDSGGASSSSGSSGGSSSGSSSSGSSSSGSTSGSSSGIADAGNDAPSLPSGSLDPGFDGTGSAIGAPPLLSDGGTVRLTSYVALTADSQGRLLAAGSVTTPYQQVYLWRFLASGEADTSFGTNGQTTYPDLGDNDYPEGLCVDGSGNVLVAGYTLSVGAELWRFTSTGAVDTAFGTNGEVEPPDNGAGSAYAVACTAAGTLVAGGADPYGATVWRYTPAGALDTTGFASPNGFVQDDSIYGAYTSAHAMAIDGTGNIVLAGTVENSIGTQDFGAGVWRFSGSGGVDAWSGGSALVVPEQQFDAGGVDAGGFAWSNATGVAIDSSGNVVVSTGAGVGRLTSTGTLDTTFAGGVGRLDMPAPAAAGAGSAVQVFGVTVDGLGRILVVGTTTPASGGTFMTVWRLTSAGALDTTFGTGGSFATRGTAGGTEGDMGNAILVDSSNRAYVGGASALASGNNVPVVWRLTP